MGNAKLPTGLESRDGSIRISFMWRGRRCRETIKLAPNSANLKYASRLRGEILRAIEIGTFRYGQYFPDSPLAKEGHSSAMTFKEVAETWIESGELAKSTKTGYRKILNRLYEKIGQKPINTIGYMELSDLLSGEWTKKTRNNILICIRRPFDIASIEGLIAVNPALRLRYLRTQTPPPDPFEPQEADAIIREIGKRYGPQVENYCGLGFYMGSRPSEQIAFKWGDIDWNSGILRIERARVLQEDKETKTGQVRDHELSAKALAYLEAQRSHTQLQRGLVFLDPVTGNQYNDEKPFRERYWRPTLQALKMRYREPYQMRHTYATLAIMAGANPVWVARQMGNSPRVVFKHYARWIERIDRNRERNKMDDFLGQNWDKTEGNVSVTEGKRLDISE